LPLHCLENNNGWPHWEECKEKATVGEILAGQGRKEQSLREPAENLESLPRIPQLPSTTQLGTRASQLHLRSRHVPGLSRLRIGTLWRIRGTGGARELPPILGNRCPTLGNFVETAQSHGQPSPLLDIAVHGRAAAQTRFSDGVYAGVPPQAPTATVVPRCRRI